MGCLHGLRRFFRWVRSLLWKRQMELALVGLNGSGKSTFTQLISSGRFNEHAIPTLGAKMRKFTKGKVDIKIWDLGGQPRFRCAWCRYCRGVDAILFMLDAGDRHRWRHAREELNQLLDMASLEGIPLLVLGNKIDLNEVLSETELVEMLALEEIGKERPVACFMVSCKDGRNIDAVIQWLMEHAKK